MDSKNIKYLILSIILLILSGFSVFLVFKINNSPLDLLLSSTPTPEITPTPEVIIPTATPIIEITPEATITPKKSPITPTPTKKLTPTPTAKITATPTPITLVTPTTSVNQSTFTSTEDSFLVNYSKSRKLYQDKESSGNRYTFYLSSGNFAIHVSPSGIWSWTISNRVFSSNYTVSGQNTFRYDIATQTIVDLQSATKNYTLQCVHNGNATLKAECETFLQSFKLQ